MFCSFLGFAEGLMDVLKGEAIPVGLPDVDLSRPQELL